MKDSDRELWEDVGHSLGGEVVESMTWEYFVMRFQDEFVLVIEV